MKQLPTVILKTVIILLGLAVLLACLVILPAGITDPGAGAYRPILIGMYIPAVPFFIGLYQALKLLKRIDLGEVFSQQSIKALKYIKNCGFIISGFYALGLPYIFIVADADDAPGIVLIGLIFSFAPLAVAVLAAVLQKLLQDAMNMKTENELTV